MPPAARGEAGIPAHPPFSKTVGNEVADHRRFHRKYLKTKFNKYKTSAMGSVLLVRLIHWTIASALSSHIAQAF